MIRSSCLIAILITSCLITGCAEVQLRSPSVTGGQVAITLSEFLWLNERAEATAVADAVKHCKGPIMVQKKELMWEKVGKNAIRSPDGSLLLTYDVLLPTTVITFQCLR